MANLAIAKKRAYPGTGIKCRVIGVRSAFADRTASFLYPDSPLWAVEGPLGPGPLTPRTLDLLDLVGGIYRIESQIAARPTNPVREWQIHAGVRDVEFWFADGGTLLASVLGFLNRALWTFTFSKRKKSPDLEYEADLSRTVKEVILFSGGMDSACGAGLHEGRKDQVQLVAYSSNQGPLQESLAKKLGYAAPTRWRLKGHRGKEGMDLIRSLMFLTLGAVVAETFGASSVFQYENGFLAAAIPPAGNFIPTRHAHPELHRRFERLLKATLKVAPAIRNPFATMTKREVVRNLKKTLGPKLSESVLRETQTCWRLAQATVGGEPKTPWVPCGVCTPCIVRRMARPQEAQQGAWPGWSGYAFDLLDPKVANHDKLGLTFRAYLELVEIALTATDDWSLIEELAPEGRELIGGPSGPSSKEAADLLRRFAKEFCNTFQITMASKKS